MQVNNFDFIRLFFALAVIITHSYTITGTPESDEFLFKLTNKSIYFATIGVAGFFVISGYLIMESLKRSRSLVDYFSKRVLRIFPGLFAVLLVTVVLGLFISEVPVGEYMFNLEAVRYIILNLTLFAVKFDMKGIFENNPYPNIINGSLWTIQYEFLFYGLLAFLYPVRNNKKVLIGALSTAFCTGLAISFLYKGGDHKLADSVYIPYSTFRVWALTKFGMYFVAGALLSTVQIKHFRYKKQLLVSALVLTVITMAAGIFRDKATFLLLPIVVIISGLSATRGIADFNKKTGGDLSYGIYLYGFLVQQTLVYFLPQIEPWELTLLTMPISLVCGYFSWNLVEKKPLRLKGKFNQSLRPITASHLEQVAH